MGTDAIRSSTGGLPARLVLGPALRAQSDRRLVGLVRDGYESAFEEIVRRYRRPLDRFAAGIVGGRSEDVTQDSFRKALEALRRGEAEVELRPWLYRIVRNTALNDLRDRPPAAAELAEDLIGGGRSVAAEAEERETIAALTARLRALPGKQRAALVMRELEGMSHEEIAAALGISGGAARQAIARGRAAVRSGFGALVPLPLLRALASGAGNGGGTAAALGEAAGGGAVVGGALGGASAIGGGAIGAGALKVGLATVLVAGSIGAGVAVEHHGGGHRPGSKGAAASTPGGPGAHGDRLSPAPVVADVDNGRESSTEGDHDHRRDRGDGEDADVRRRDESREGGDHRGDRDGDDVGDAPSSSVAAAPVTVADHGKRGADGGPGPDRDDDSRTGAGNRSEASDHRHGGGGPGSSATEGRGGDHDSGGSHREGDSDSDPGSGHGGSRPDGGGSGSGGGPGSAGGSRSSGKHGGHGSDDPPTIVGGASPVEASDSTDSGSSSGSGGPGSGSGSSGSGSSGGDDSTSLPSPPTSGSGGGPSSPAIESSVGDEDSHPGGGPGSSEESEVLP